MMLLMFPISSYAAARSGAYLQLPSTMNLYWYTPGGSSLTTAKSFPCLCMGVRVDQLS